MPCAICFVQGAVKGFFPAVLSTAVLPIGGFFMALPVTRNLIARCLPGEAGVSRGGRFFPPIWWRELSGVLSFFLF